MQNILEFNLKELEVLMLQWQEPPFRARQILSWLYQKGVMDFSRMTNLSGELKHKLKEHFSFPSLKLLKILESGDGTKKFLLELADKNYIEAVTIPAKARLTGCVSTQVGCKFSCRFCASGALGFKRNLSSAEILEEVLFLKNNLSQKLTHLVFMGTGEPLDNYDQVLKAIRMINSPEGLHIGARRITISTAGIIPEIRRLAEEGLQIELSVSLHAADEKTRSLIMPVNIKYPLNALILACKNYIKKTNRQITFEYILIKGLNSDLQNARNLATILKGMNCKVNIIPANPVKELKVEPAEPAEINVFKEALLKSGVRVTLRKPRGEDIQAACGQLRLGYEKK
jgi:23S rRNA (adenine2503-C2)-methyltransferase